MAKTQTFGDKVKKKKNLDTRTNVKVVRGIKGDDGSMRFIKTFVKVNELSELDKVR